MNKWECDFPKCRVTATGEGVAKGLEHIGWEVKPGEGIGGGLLILCPVHKGCQPIF